MPAILLLACLLLTLYCSAAVAETKAGVVVNGQTYTIDTEAHTAILTMGVLNGKKVTVPDTVTMSGDVTKYEVVGIASSAFSLNGISKLEIALGTNLRYIRSKAFQFTNCTVNKITFFGAKCTDIATDAFSGIKFEYLPISSMNYCESTCIVWGEDGCMETALSNVDGLKYFTGLTGTKADGGYYNQIKYKNKPKTPEADSLQAQINSAPDNVETTIRITSDIEVADTVRVPAGKKIVLVDDGQERTIYATYSLEFYEGKVFVVEKNATLTIAATENNKLILRGTQNSGDYKIIDVYGKLNLKKGTLTAGKTNATGCGSVVVNNGAEFNMTGGLIQFAHSYGVLNAAVVVKTGGYFDMSGGGIVSNFNHNRSASGAGGVLLYTWGSNEAPAKMKMSGNALINKNTTACSGGGVYLIGNAELLMTGGTISENSADTNSSEKNGSGKGGGVCVALNDYGEGKFTMEGGTISQNSAFHGGGIYVYSNQVELKGGRIIGNTAKLIGGGIYVSTTPYEVHLENALITGNRATTMGGGLWLCPQGYAEVHVTNGGAIYNNKAKPEDPKQGEAAKPITDAAADDIASIWYTAEKGNGLTLADRMLGGGKVDYYNDGTIGWSQTVTEQFAGTELGKVAEGSQRFDPANPGEPLSNKTNNRENLALISVASDDAKALAEKTAKLVISGNTATRGGGIGANGGVIIGTKNAATYPLTIKKDWGNTPDSLKQEITLHLVVDNCKLDAVKLNANNSWTATLTGFAYEDLDPQQHKVTLVEDNAPAGFKLSVSELTYDKENRTFAISATNVYTPIAPDKPEIEIPKTGDSSHIGLMIVAMAASLLGLLACALAGKRRGNR